MSHTPGPWVTQPIEDNGEVFIVSGRGEGLVGAALPWPTEVDGGSRARIISNARLIAAAPEMLAVLKRVRDRFFPAEQSEDAQDLLWEPVNSAIAKAEGKL